MITLGGKTPEAIFIASKEVAAISINNDQVWVKTQPTPPTPTVDYFYVENEYAGSNKITIRTEKYDAHDDNPDAPALDLTKCGTSIEWSKDGTTWTTETLSDQTPVEINMSQGETVYFRNDSGKLNFNDYNYGSCWFNYINCDEDYSVGGDIYTIIDYTGTHISDREEACLSSLFESSTTLIDSSDLDFTQNSVKNHEYSYMFGFCENMTDCPDSLPATSLATECYYGMFLGTSSMTTPPSLPATTLAQNCYGSMFESSGITSTPALPATTLAPNCYAGMFNSSGITSAPALPATTLESDCYASMFSSCYSLTASPVLPATTLVIGCYSSMFSYCENLNTVTTYAEDVTAQYCTDGWLDGVAGSGTFYNNGSANFRHNSIRGIPTGWTEVKPTDYVYIQNTYAGQNTITVTTTESGSPAANTHAASVQYSKDKTNWTTMTFVTGYANAQTITMDEGETVYFRNSSGKFSYDSILDSYKTSFTNSQSCIVGGDVRTLLDYTDYEEVTVPQGAFYGLFSENLKITDASRIKLPDEIPAYGCKYMFHANYNMTVPPEIPATEVGEYGCQNMFSRCAHLTTAPVLKSKTLTMGCYEQMFYDCSLLNSVTTHATNISASGCLTGWLSGVANSGTFNNVGLATYTAGSENGIPTGWTELRAPSQPTYSYSDDYNECGQPSGLGTLTTACSTQGAEILAKILTDTSDPVEDSDFDLMQWERYNLSIELSYFTNYEGEQGTYYIQLKATKSGYPDSLITYTTVSVSEEQPCAVDCSDWENMGYSSYEDCDCAENNNCPEEEPEE